LSLFLWLTGDDWIRDTGWSFVGEIKVPLILSLFSVNDNGEARLSSGCFFAKCVLRKYLLQNERSHKLQ
jgi:hypothetical protein